MGFLEQKRGKKMSVLLASRYWKDGKEGSTELRRPQDQWMMVIDLDRCIGCGCCEVACRLEKGVPGLMRVVSTDSSVFFPYHCRHCEEPKCAQACPTRAIRKRKDGIVQVEEDRCVSCKLCAEACPYGIPSFNGEEKMAKCDFCLERLKRDLWPACATKCSQKALYFGKMEDLEMVLRDKEIKGLGRMVLD